MSILESCMKVCHNVFEMVEEKINLHFKNLDDKSTNAISQLKVSDLAFDIAKTLNIKDHVQVINLVNIYVDLNPTIEVRSGKNGGIFRVGDSKMPMTPQECALKYYNNIALYAPSFIENVFCLAEQKAILNKDTSQVRINFQDLCEDIASNLKIKSYSVYHCLRKYIREESKDFEIARGAHGGLVRKMKVS